MALSEFLTGSCYGRFYHPVYRKSHLPEKVAELISEEDKIESNSLTSNALYYFGEYDLQHKLILKNCVKEGKMKINNQYFILLNLRILFIKGVDL